MGFLGSLAGDGCVGIKPNRMRGISFSCITSWVFGECIDVSIRSRLFSYGGVSFFSLFVPTVFTESIIYILCQSMMGKLGLRFGEEPKRFTSGGRMESLSLF